MALAFRPDGLLRALLDYDDFKSCTQKRAPPGHVGLRLPHVSYCVGAADKASCHAVHSYRLQRFWGI